MWGYADAEWGLRTRYDMPTILREALEEYLAVRKQVPVEAVPCDGRKTPI